MKDPQALTQWALARRAFCRTLPRQQVLDAFTRHHLPMTAAEVHQRLKDRRINLASVYRAINFFCRLGVLTAVDHVAEGRRYELSDEHRSHHHHLICQGCGTIQDFEACFLGEFERRARKEKRFRILRHELRFFGLCQACVA